MPVTVTVTVAHWLPRTRSRGLRVRLRCTVTGTHWQADPTVMGSVRRSTPPKGKPGPRACPLPAHDPSLPITSNRDSDSDSDPARGPAASEPLTRTRSLSLRRLSETQSEAGLFESPAETRDYDSSWPSPA